MSTPANPQHLLRRPKKPQPKHFDWRIVAAGAVVAVVAGGGFAGFAAFSHARSAAEQPAPLPTQRSAALPSVENFSTAFSVPAPAKHKPHKSSSPEASPSPDATQTPQPSSSPTPATEATTLPAHAPSSATGAAAKHEAALKAAAARRAALALTAPSSVAAGSQTTTFPTQPAPPPVPVPTSVAPPPATATPEPAPTPVYAPTIVVDARFVQRVTPVYPDIAKEQGVGGTAIVLATVGPDGRVLSVSVDQSTGDRLLDGAAVDAARASRFAPPEIDGKPATETYRIVYTFDPNG